MKYGDKQIVIKTLFAIRGIYDYLGRSMNRFNSVKVVDGNIFVMNIYRIDSDIKEDGASF